MDIQLDSQYISDFIRQYCEQVWGLSVWLEWTDPLLILTHFAGIVANQGHTVDSSIANKGSPHHLCHLIQQQQDI